jgi:hypothetical protein
MTKKKILSYVVSFILFIGILFVTYNLFFTPDKKKQESRRQILWVYNNLELGKTKTDVKNLFKVKNENNNLLKLYSNNSDKWIVHSPYEFGATDWVLGLEFSSDHLVSVKIRLSDSARFKPKESPPDKDFSGKDRPVTP